MMKRIILGIDGNGSREIILLSSAKQGSVIVVKEDGPANGYKVEAHHSKVDDLGPVYLSEMAEDAAWDAASHVFGMIGSRSYKNAVDHGFWGDTDRPDRNDAEAIALMHSELSEMLESVRHDNPKSEKIPDFTNTEEEAADLLIRFFDWAQGRGLRVAEAVRAKMNYNKSRPHKHGKKF